VLTANPPRHGEGDHPQDGGGAPSVRATLALAAALAAALTGCNRANGETPEACIARFARVLADLPAFEDARYQPVFTYDVTHMNDVLETLVGRGDALAGTRVTIAHGALGASLTEFLQAEVGPKGAIFAADRFTLYRIGGTPAAPGQAIAEGCRKAPAEARLTHIQWIALPRGNAAAGRTGT